MGKLIGVLLLIIVVTILFFLIDPLVGVVWMASLVGVVICIIKVCKKK